MNNLEKSIVQSMTDLGPLLPVADAIEMTEEQRLDISMTCVKMGLKLTRLSKENGEEPLSEEFYLAFAKATPALLREVFLAGGCTNLGKMVESF